MSVDERLRSAFREQAEVLTPEVDDALADVRRRGRAARRRGAALGLVAAAAAATVVGVIAGLDLGGRGEGLPAGGPSSPAEDGSRSPVGPTTPTGSLRGGLDGTVTTPRELAGAWSLQLNGNATLDVSPPADYAGTVAGALFTADGSTFRTTLFGADLCAGDGTGIYRWLAVGDRVEFEVVSEPCLARSQFFEDTDWTVSTGSRPRG